ncbi:MAG: DUF799 family lipoprotein [Bacteroidales bacterium]|nr:DUF799 family lipoprotein [Bacteroidales bacterium]
MKKIIILLTVVIFLSSCSLFKKTAKDNEAKEVSSTKTEKVLSEKDKQRQRTKDLEKKRKEQIKEQKRANKEYEKKKKAEEKEKKKKEKEQDKLIKNSAKSERQRIKEERRKEKETLLSAQKLQEQEKKEQERIQKELDSQLEKQLREEEKQQELLEKQQKELEANAENEEERKKEELVKKLEKIEAEKKQKEEQEKKEFEALSTMDQIVYRMKHPKEDIDDNQKQENTTKKEFDINNYTDEDLVTLTDEEKKKILSSKDEKKEGNIFKRTYKKLFPKKVPRSTAYNKLYNEHPKTVVVLYPWNRSDYSSASEMAYTSCVRELSSKGYYLPSALAFMDEIRKDSLLTTKNINLDRIKECKAKYGADMVLLLTIYRVEKPWWSTNINVVAHYDFISTATGDTLFSRHADFNYDTPMPTKTKKNDKLIKDAETSLYLGLFEQMQRYVLLDMPVGPYHEKYGQDGNKRSQPQEKKYKVNIKPS